MHLMIALARLAFITYALINQFFSQQDSIHFVSTIYHASIYRKTFNISRTLVGYKIVDYSDVVGAPPVCAAPTTSSFSTEHLASMHWAKTTARGYKNH